MANPTIAKATVSGSKTELAKGSSPSAKAGNVVMARTGNKIKNTGNRRIAIPLVLGTAVGAIQYCTNCSLQLIPVKR